MKSANETFHVYLLVDCSWTASGKLQDGVKDATTSVLQTLRHSFSGLSIKISVIRFCSTARKVIAQADLDQFELPNFKADRTSGVKLGDGLTVLGNDMKRSKDKKKNISKTIAFVFSHNNPTESIHKQISDLQQWGQQFELCLISCGNKDLSSYIKGSFPHFSLAEFETEHQRILRNFLLGTRDIPQVVEPEPQPLPFLWQEEDLQALIDTHQGPILTLLPREYRGPARITKPLILDGKGATIWSLQGPVLTIEEPNVKLQNLRVEVTGSLGNDNPEHDIAIHGKQSYSLDNVEVRGMLTGKAEEAGAWQYPHSLHIGQLPSKVKHEFYIRIEVPVACRLVSQISDLDVYPEVINPGLHTIRFTMEQRSNDMLIHGKIYLLTPEVKRSITLNAYIGYSDQVSILDQFPDRMIWRADEQPDEPEPAAPPAPERPSEPTNGLESEVTAPILPSSIPLQEPEMGPDSGTEQLPAAGEPQNGRRPRGSGVPLSPIFSMPLEEPKSLPKPDHSAGTDGKSPAVQAGRQQGGDIVIPSDLFSKFKETSIAKSETPVEAKITKEENESSATKNKNRPKMPGISTFFLNQ